MAAEGTSRSQVIAAVVHRQVSGLARGYAKGDGEAASAGAASQLAQLRQGNINTPGADPRTWEVTICSIPEELLGREDRPNDAELSIHAAITLFAFHQQSKRTPMHEPGKRFGRAMWELARTRGGGADLDPGTIIRFRQVVTAGSHAMRVRHLRSLVGMLNGSSIPLDYGALAKDLFQLNNPQWATSVSLRWARDFHQRPADSIKNSNDATTKNPEGAQA